MSTDTGKLLISYDFYNLKFRNNVDLMRDELQKKFLKIKLFNFDYRDNNQTFMIMDYPVSECTWPKLEILHKELSDIFDKLNLRFSLNEETLILNDVPSSKVQTKRIELIAQESLAGIHKVISNCEYMEISWLQNVKQNALGLVLLDTDDLYFEGNVPEWAKIIMKHFKSGKDVLDCQEELIENGYKQYAKL